MRIAPGNFTETRDIDHVRVLERRIEWLDDRIKTARRSKYNPKFDVAERDALRWALETVKNWIDLPNEDDELKDF
jgi:hypothetical protein